MKVTIFNATENPTIEDLEKVIKVKLGDKYTYKSTRKAKSTAGKLLNSSSADSVTVIKNAYHRTTVSLETIKDASLSTGLRTSVYFSEAKLAGWLTLLHREGRWLGRIIIRTIYGVSSPIYQEVKDAVKLNIKGEDETSEVGLASFLRKKK